MKRFLCGLVIGLALAGVAQAQVPLFSEAPDAGAPIRDAPSIHALLATLLIFLAGTAGLQAATYGGTLSSQLTGFEPVQPRAGVPFHANIVAEPASTSVLIPHRPRWSLWRMVS